MNHQAMKLQIATQYKFIDHKTFKFVFRIVFIPHTHTHNTQKTIGKINSIKNCIPFSSYHLYRHQQRNCSQDNNHDLDYIRHQIILGICVISSSSFISSPRFFLFNIILTTLTYFTSVLFSLK